MQLSFFDHAMQYQGGRKSMRFLNEMKEIIPFENLVSILIEGGINKRIWQRNYYEHIIQDDMDYERVATYTINNPTTWDEDILK